MPTLAEAQHVLTSLLTLVSLSIFLRLFTEMSAPRLCSFVRTVFRVSSLEDCERRCLCPRPLTHPTHPLLGHSQVSVVGTLALAAILAKLCMHGWDGGEDKASVSALLPPRTSGSSTGSALRFPRAWAAAFLVGGALIAPFLGVGAGVLCVLLGFGECGISSRSKTGHVVKVKHLTIQAV